MITRSESQTLDRERSNPVTIELGERPEPVSMNGRHRRWAITFLSGERPAPQRPPYVDAVFARDDLKPAFVQAARLLL